MYQYYYDDRPESQAEWLQWSAAVACKGTIGRTVGRFEVSSSGKGTYLV